MPSLGLLLGALAGCSDEALNSVTKPVIGYGLFAESLGCRAGVNYDGLEGNISAFEIQNALFVPSDPKSCSERDSYVQTFDQIEIRQFLDDASCESIATADSDASLVIEGIYDSKRIWATKILQVSPPKTLWNPEAD